MERIIYRIYALHRQAGFKLIDIVCKERIEEIINKIDGNEFSTILVVKRNITLNYDESYLVKTLYKESEEKSYGRKRNK